MKHILFFLITALMLWAMPMQAKNDDPVELTTTFLVMMPKGKASTVNKTLKAQDGVSKVDVNTAEQKVVVTFMSDKNTVSNLVNVFKQMGITAAALETGCFGSKEGCINAIKPENTMR
jgi:copper chaperone CopZ